MQSIRLILGESMKKIIINKNSWQTRIAITEDGKLVNLYLSAHVEQPLERIYLKGTVTKVLPGIQTAFVDIGQPKAGFLHISEIDRDLAITNMSQRLQLDESGNNIQTKPKKRPTPEISKILKEGDPILVQVSKEPVYEKGAKLTTCFTLPGRFIVLMPNIPRIGISKKIDNREERNRLREVVTEALPEGMGAIIRTTSADRGKREIKKDITYLVNTWKTIQKNYKAAQPRDIIHEDLEIALQIVRDHLDADVETVISDNTEHQKTIHKFVKVVAPDFAWVQELEEQEGFKTVHFDFDSDKIKTEERGNVKKNVTTAKKVLADNSNEPDQPTIVIEGHSCHSAGSSAYNLALSEKRAAVLKAELTKQGVPEENIKVVGRGNEIPAVKNGKVVTGDKYQQAPNRRDEVRVIYS